MQDTQEFKTRLEAQLTELTAELTTLGIHDPDADDWITTPDQPQTGEPDENEHADSVEDWNERRAILSNLETRYNNTKRALEKIATGTFGSCEICQEHIALD